MSHQDGPEPVYSFFASILGMTHSANNPVRQLDFYEDRISIYTLRRVKYRLFRNRFLRYAYFSDVRRCHYTSQGTLMFGGMGIMGPGISQMATPSKLEISVFKFHYLEDKHHHLWDDLTKTDHFVIAGEIREGKLEEMYGWLRDKVRENGGKLEGW